MSLVHVEFYDMDAGRNLTKVLVQGLPHSVSFATGHRDARRWWQWRPRLVPNHGRVSARVYVDGRVVEDYGTKSNDKGRPLWADGGTFTLTLPADYVEIVRDWTPERFQ